MNTEFLGHSPSPSEQETQPTLPSIERPILPEPAPYGVIHSSELHNPVLAHPDQNNPAYVEARQKELIELGNQIENLPSDTFKEMRDQETQRISMYFDAFAKVFGIDLRAVTSTRQQMGNSAYMSTVVWLQTLFEPDQVGEANPKDNFFLSRLYAGADNRYQFNASGVDYFQGMNFVFSVLQRKVVDSEGEFIVDYPAYSMSRDFFASLDSWNQAEYPGQSLQENPLLKHGVELTSRRIHDWVHAAILYDVKSKSQIFQKWANDIYFVQHIFNSPAMINYEVLAHYLHFAVWQQTFRDHPETKTQVLNEVKNYLTEVEKYGEWLKKQGSDPEETEKKIDFTAYVGIRSIIDVLHDDEEILAVLADNPGAHARYQKVLGLMRENMGGNPRQHIDALSEQGLKMAFGKDRQAQLTVQEILERYVDSLVAEAERYAKDGIITALMTDVPKPGEYPLAEEFIHLPDHLKKQFKDLPLTDFDPRMFRLLNAALREIRIELGNDQLYEVLLNNIEVDAKGFLYSKLNRDEIDFSNSVEVVQKKKALLVQIPYSTSGQYAISLERSLNLLQTQVGSSALAKPGDVILINIQDKEIAEELLSSSQEEGQLNIQMLLDVVKKKATHGIVDLYDMYVYDPEKAAQVFGLSTQKNEDGHINITPGHYETLPNRRKAINPLGPISIDSVNDATVRHRIVEGAVVENNVKKNNEVDIFPVHTRNFDQFYRADRKKLPGLELTREYFIRNGLLPADSSPEATAAQFRRLKATYEPALQKMQEVFSRANDINQYGYRGKPEVPLSILET